MVFWCSIPGNYNWRVAEPFIDTNQNGLYDGHGSSDYFNIDMNPDGSFNPTDDDFSVLNLRNMTHYLKHVLEVEDSGTFNIILV